MIVNQLRGMANAKVVPSATQPPKADLPTSSPELKELKSVSAEVVPHGHALQLKASAHDYFSLALMHLKRA